MNRAIVDIETGGFSVTKNGICEIGMLIIDEKFDVISEYSTLIKPYTRPDSTEMVSYKDDAMAVNGIEIKDLINKGLDVRTVCHQLNYLIYMNKVGEFIGHNIKSFDAPRLNHFFERFSNRQKIDFSNYQDTMSISRKINKDLKSHSLQSLCEFYGIVNDSEHRALGDCRATLEVYKRLMIESS